MTTPEPLLKVNRLSKFFPVRSGLLLRQTGTVRAVDDVSFELHEGETLGLVGESGCGKSTLGRTIMRIYPATTGSVKFQGANVHGLWGWERMTYFRDVKMIFQDPYSSLNPRRTVSHILSSPLKVHGIGDAKERRQRVDEILYTVGLGAWAAGRYPHEFSGGQRQRIAIARAIILKPKLVIADEPVSALDVSVQAQILNLMNRLQGEMKMAYLFIAHNLAVVRHMSRRIAVMYLGKVVELADRNELFSNPKHPYTQALIEANPVPGEGRKRLQKVLKGDVPSPLNPPSGCYFHPRCPIAEDRCRVSTPELRNLGSRESEHWVSCHLAK